MGATAEREGEYLRPAPKGPKDPAPVQGPGLSESGPW